MKFKFKPLAIMMALLPVALLPASTATFASDLTLYKGNTTGKTSILLMLDTSGSMGISSLVLPNDNQYGSPGDVTTPLCNKANVYESGGNKAGNTLEYQYNATDSRNTVKVNGTSVTNPTKNKTSFYKEVIIGGTTVPYYVRGCGTATVDSTGNLVETAAGKFDRLSRLKDAILTLLADRTKLSDTIQIGLGHFSTQTALKVGSATSNIQFVDGHSGNILVPVAALNDAQRLKLAQAIAQFQSLDTTTKQDGSAADTESDGGTTAFKQRNSSKNPPQNIKKASSGTPTAHAYAEAAAYMMGTQTRPNTLSTGYVQYVYDGASIIRRRNSTNNLSANDLNDQSYFICVVLGTTPTSILGGTDNVKQCVNNWPVRDGTKVKSSTVTAGVYKPNGSGGWTAVSQAELTSAMGNLSDDWDLYSQFPTGWRYGGWMKVNYEAMDIEPVAAAAWDQNSVMYRNLVTYRTNPFALTESALSASGNPYTDNLSGGISYSASDTKNTAGTQYIAGGSTSTCDGNGIYFLTDGAPNSTKDSMAQSIMNDTLTTTLAIGSPAGTYGFSSKPTGGLVSPALKSGLFSGETGGWEYIGEFAKKLRNRTETSNTQKNPKDMNIKTAVVGFGASFAGLTKNADGTYNCASAPNDDAKNACLWGNKAYGDGGFYYAENSDDIKNSIINFVSNVTPTFPPSSLGTISVPRDPLDQTQLMSTGFFPMIMPQNGNFLTWGGNLKKYKILAGTLKDSSNNAIYTTQNNQQIINSSAKDLWSIADTTGTDHSLINSGGAWNKIPVPSNLSVTGEPSNASSERRVFTIDGTTLKQVTKASLATDYTGTTPSALDTTNVTVPQRYALLNYLGYKTTFPPATGATLTTTQVNSLAVVPASPYRYLGGVVHSTPLVVTDTATLNSSGNAVGSRKEYVVYGSMEGGLHIVDASTGEEKSVFVPKEILNSQYAALANSDFKMEGGLAYGVDAPWTADNTFKVVSTTSSGVTTTKYQANRINIYGGLRMGGQALYGLNISTPTSPALLFQITPSTAGFGRMGQIWSKPTIADIRVKGVRKRVLIFGGGYDASVYERSTATFTEPTTATQGNAIYVVDASNGALLWMASSDTSGVTDSYKKTTASEMLYSVVGQPVVRDYDADGLADMIYFADLGGQIFRVDLNNTAQTSSTTDVNLGVRVQRLANLRQGSGSTLFVPRFYDRLTTGVFGNGASRFVLVSAGSGNRSFPLDASKQRNKIYGIMDYDAAIKGIESTSYSGTFADVATSSNIASRGTLGKTGTTIQWGTSGSITDDKIATAMGVTGANVYRGWKFDLISTGDDATNANYYSNSFEESQLVSGDLYVNVYDSKATLNGQVNNCGGGVQGLSTTHRICAPFGDCAAYVKQDYQGIIGPTLGLNTDGTRTSRLVGPISASQEACVGKCPANNGGLTDQNLFNYSQARKIKPTKWYER